MQRALVSLQRQDIIDMVFLSQVRRQLAKMLSCILSSPHGQLSGEKSVGFRIDDRG